MNYDYQYKDNSMGKWLIIKVYVESAFNPVEFAYDDDDALKIYKLLVSKNKKAIKEFINEEIQKEIRWI